MPNIKKNRIGIIAIIVISAIMISYHGFAGGSNNSGDKADGRIVNGARLIQIDILKAPQTIHVFRGDTIKLIIDGGKSDYLFKIPEYEVSQEVGADEKTEVKFKSKKIGDFPFYYSELKYGGQERKGQIRVLQYQTASEAIYEELSADQAKTLIDDKKPLILDVRTPREFQQARIENSTLIPVQELMQRLSEIEEYKDRDVLIYCRSGNRSTVAAAIMVQNGFKKLYNLRYGINSWAKKGYRIVR